MENGGEENKKMNRISTWIKQNTMLKLLSLFLAFVIWLTVVNFSNPEIKDVTTVEVEVLNGDKLTSADKIYSLNSKTVKINYKVRTKDRNKVKPSDFRAYIDLKDYSITGAVPVYVEVSDNVRGMISGATPSPMVIHVTTEDLQKKRFEIELNTIGSPMEGYYVANGSVSPGYVYISGPVSEIGQISKVGIEVDVTEANTDLSGDASLKFYDANGNPISVDGRIKANRDSISYMVPIQKIKSLSITADVMGEPAEGYVFEEIDLSPNFISVYGPDSVLKKHLSISIPASEMDITGSTKSITKAIDITPYIPQGLNLAQPGAEITVIAKIRKLPETTVSETEDESASESESETEESSEEPSSEHTKETNAENKKETVSDSKKETASESRKETSGETKKETVDSTELSTEDNLE
ncbi:MAG: CdaR family protein [Eubacteriales bacterium]|nr:CdaR family protein [Eubacteriales bacterium]